MSSGKSSKSSAARRGCAASSGAAPTDTTKCSSAEIKALLTANKWWPFHRVDGKILQQMHRSIEAEKSTTDNLEEAPW